MARILIAEDEPDIRELVAFTLRFAGHEVTTTANGEEALNQATQIIPDLILMDVRMPRMTGYDACRAMKATPNLKQDRKSTRLNSSHVEISYAVFCLKKKKKK